MSIHTHPSAHNTAGEDHQDVHLGLYIAIFIASKVILLHLYCYTYLLHWCTLVEIRCPTFGCQYVYNYICKVRRVFANECSIARILTNEVGKVLCITTA